MILGVEMPAISELYRPLSRARNFVTTAENWSGFDLCTRVISGLIVMDPFFHLSGHPKSCKWCGVVKPQVVFESSVLCSPCHAKALSAQSNPSLCDLCASLFASKKSLDALTSEDGFESKSLQYFRESAERGCTLCRIFLLQDPNPADERGADWTNIFAEIEGGEGDGLDIKGVYFWSMPDQYRVFLSVAAEEGEL